MHGAFASDLGGNSVSNLRFNGGTWNLHSLWDSGLIAKRVGDDFNGNYDRFNDHLLSRASRTSIVQDPRAISNVTASFACEYAYFDTDGSGAMLWPNPDPNHNSNPDPNPTTLTLTLRLTHTLNSH